MPQDNLIFFIFFQNSGPIDAIKEFNLTLSGLDLGNTLKARAAMAAAISCSKTLKIAINIGGCYGEDNYMMVICILKFI